MMIDDAPKLRVGQYICSEVLMGKIMFARKYDGNWYYIIEQPMPHDRYTYEQIQDIDVRLVWRNGRWTDINR